MNSTQPEAESEYSTRRRASEGVVGGARAAARGACGLGLTGAALLLAAELTPLLRVDSVARHPVVIRTVETGPHHGWALVPVAGLAAALATAMLHPPTRTAGVRTAAGLLGLLGLAALGIALLADLPAARATGLVGTPATGLHDAVARAATGLYLETLGAFVLLLAGAVGGLVRRPEAAPAGPRAERVG
jgi:hypothetical protein